MIKINKKLVLLLVLLLLMSTLVGCTSSKDANYEDEFVFSEDDFQKMLIEFGSIVRNDIETLNDTYGAENKNMDKDPLIRKYRFYNDSDLTKKQREKLDITLNLQLAKTMYILVPHDKKTKDELYEASCKYAELVDKDYDIKDLIYK